MKMMSFGFMTVKGAAAGFFVIFGAVVLCAACAWNGLPVAKGEDLSLVQITETERAGAYFPGLALAESGLREKAGDHAGAAVAFYKELAWAFACGAAEAGVAEEKLLNAIALFGDASRTASPAALPQRSAGAAALRGCLAFNRGEWSMAEELLAVLCQADDEPDSFLRWMLLVCSLEQAPGRKDSLAAYGAIRDRYTRFPGYWYRGARAFLSDKNAAAACAEQCINASPRGPYAAECRLILGEQLGFSPDEKDLSLALRTTTETGNIIRASVSLNDPEKLLDLFPLMALPDNPYTLCAMGAMRALAPVPEYRAFFIERAIASGGRLGERLNYISRG